MRAIHVCSSQGTALASLWYAVHVCTYACAHVAVQEGQLSYEEAIIARQNHISETRGKVSLMKEEVRSLDGLILVLIDVAITTTALSHPLHRQRS